LPDRYGAADLILATDLWVGALIRRAQAGGAFAMVARKGDPRAGAVLVKTVPRPRGRPRLYAMAMRADGEEVWMQPAPDADEEGLDRYVERAARIDPDIWLVEIEDRQGRHFLTEPVDDSAP
jgi:hypothetical protein